MKDFANHTTLTKVVSVILVATGAVGLVFWGYTYILRDAVLSQAGNGYLFFYMFFLFSLAVLGIACGIALWRKKVWALVVAALYFAMQMIGIGGPHYYWYPYLAFEMNVHLNLGPYWIALNFFALFMLVLTLIAFKQIRDAVPQQPVLDRSL